MYSVARKDLKISITIIEIFLNLAQNCYENIIRLGSDILEPLIDFFSFITHNSSAESDLISELVDKFLDLWTIISDNLNNKARLGRDGCHLIILLIASGSKDYIMGGTCTILSKVLDIFTNLSHNYHKNDRMNPNNFLKSKRERSNSFRLDNFTKYFFQF